MNITKIKLVFIIAIVSVVIVFSNPLRWPESWIQTYTLNITPLDSSFNDVLQIIKKNNWKISYKNKDNGYYDQRESPGKTVGSMSIRASLGDYQGIPFQENVTVFWGFNEAGKLIDIWVWKTSNGI